MILTVRLPDDIAAQLSAAARAAGTDRSSFVRAALVDSLNSTDTLDFQPIRAAAAMLRNAADRLDELDPGS